MANLDKYNKEQQQDPTLADKAKEKAKEQAKKKAKKKAKGAARNAFNKATDNQFNGLLGKAKGMAKQGARELLKKAAQAIKQAAVKAGQAAAKGIASLVEFLVSNPVGWIILIIIIVIVLIIIGKKAFDKKQQMDEDRFVQSTFTTIMVADADCNGVKKKTEAEEAAANVDARKEENARKIYEVFHEYGLSDIKIAGMLGNLDVESGIDATCVEGIYDEPYQIGDKKAQAVDDMDAYVRLTLFPLYDKCGTTHTKSAYKVDGKYVCGLGLAQWTAGNAKTVIDRAGDGGKWYDFDYQVAYMLTDTYYRPGFFKTWRDADDPATPVDASIEFRQKYEGNNRNGYEDTRTSKGCKTLATEWYAKIEEWNKGTNIFQDIVTNIFDFAKGLGEVVIDTATAVTRPKCPDKVGKYDNSSLASCAISYAWPTREECYNNGTALYRKVHDNIFPGDGYYKSCDRSVACAVRWSGMDEDFPVGITNDQYDYMQASDKWQSVGFLNVIDLKDLQPGDVLVLDGHILMYTGHEAIEKIHGSKASADADSVSGSLGKRSPACGNDTSSMKNNNGGMDWEGRGTYEIFRCTNTSPSDKYKNAGG